MISYQTILNKMEEKLREAKGTNSEVKVREYVQAIKTLCEIVLEEQSEQPLHQTIEPVVQPVTMQSTQTISSQTPSTLGEKRLVTDDGANGDSLFDF